MSTFMVVSAFSPGEDLPRMNAVLAEELAAVSVLRADGVLGAVHISPARGRVFLEVHVGDEGAARAVVESLPMASWWTIEVFPTMEPPAPGA